jgi:TonB family protein
MKSLVAHFGLAVGSSLAALVIAKVTVIMVLTLTGIRLTRKKRAAVRHALLAAGFVVSLAIPIVSVLFRSIRVAEVPIVAASVAESYELPPSERSTPVGGSAAVVSGDRNLVRSSRISLSALLLTGWAMGSLLFLLPVIVGLLQLRALRRSGRPWHRGESVARQLAADIGIHHRVEVVLNAMPGPGTCGFLRPIIMLPADVETWHDDDLRRALIHELEHVRRDDWTIQCLARVVCACYWFHPLVWIPWRRLILEAERSCDDSVLRRTESTAYADQLIELAGRMSTVAKRPLLTMANRTDLSVRISAVLDTRQQRGRAGKFALAIVCVASGVLIMTISPLRFVAFAQRPAPSQKFTGSLLDPVGRVVAEATVTLTSAATEQCIETRSDSTGRFSFDKIPAGEYLLQVQSFGFAPLQQRTNLTAGQNVKRIIKMQIAGVDDAITVSSSAAQAALPRLPTPLPPPASTPTGNVGQQILDRCAQELMFCRVTPPDKISDAQPVYPPRQRENRVSGTVMIKGSIGKDGLIKDLRTLAPADPEFANATTEALRRWQFTATLLDGVPVEVPIRVTANFVFE